MTDAELATVLNLLVHRGIRLVNVGHGRDAGDVARAAAFTRAWTARGREVGAMVEWPATAASWLRPARRLVAGTPEAWVIADQPIGWSGLAPRLLATKTWRPDRTIAFAALADPTLPGRTGPDATDGMFGATEDGRRWTFFDGMLVTDPEPWT